MKAKVEILGMFIIFDFMKLLTKTKPKVQILIFAKSHVVLSFLAQSPTPLKIACFPEKGHMTA
jgi:hypothetical protein